MRRFKLKLTAGNQENLSINGDYVRVIDARSDVNIKPDSGQELQGMQRGMSYSAPKIFKELAFTSDADQNIEIMAGYGSVEDNRIAGAVEVVDGGRVTVNSELAYGSVISQPAVISEYSFCQLFNPAGSGKNLIIESFTVGADKACGIGVYYGSTQLTTAGNAPVNNKVNGKASVAEAKRETNPTVNPVGATFIHVVDVPANASERVELSKPIVIPPGYGISARAATVEARLNTTFEFYEETN